MNRKPIIILVVLVVALFAIGVWLYSKYEHNVPVMLRASKSSAVVVEVVKVKQAIFPDHINTVGVLHAIQQTTISSEIAGRIQKIAFQPGTLVNKTQLLFQLDDRIYQSNLESAQAALDLSKGTYDRLMQLAKGQVSEVQIDQAKSTYFQDQAKVDVNKAYLAETAITAPFTGFIGYNKVDVGSQIEPGEALADLVDRSQLQVWYQLPESYLSRLTVNESVSVRAPVNGQEKNFNGHLTFISPNSDADTHAVSLRAIIANPDDALAPGLFVHVTQTLGAAQHALVVPEEAIVSTLSGNQVFVLNGDKVSAQTVIVGSAVNGWVPVISGLKIGDRVVTAGQDQLKEGDVVQVATAQ
ncbi:MAG: hypothetical protein A3F17_03110 [Gammaproteobacteria bacterium RIFCSPHIGHO2_12_FULL_41_15]|nr:MAG: hypothetical protein A3F17_03110 [Gammaproteobacteria bacterium RIFCSPHIGHO2_12_FULL_41_15]